MWAAQRLGRELAGYTHGLPTLATLAGMIMWPKAKRSVSDDTARMIAHVAVEQGATPVGVFVDEDAETINRRCVGQWGLMQRQGKRVEDLKPPTSGASLGRNG
jgi:phosphoribosylanthranilate isomerase